MTIQAYAAHEKGAALKPFSYSPAPLKSHEIEVKITHCGICHSDVHLINNDWGNSAYPLVPGHEIIGIVDALGTEVKNVKKGDRVGIGWQCGSCMECESCVKGEENLCAQSQAVAVGGHYGGFADRVRSDSRFAFRIPEKLASENAAPLLCGGATVYSPFRNYNVRAFMKVGVIGIGGLGHLALQYAKAFGCEVTAFSNSPSKEKEAKQFGADHFVSSTSANSFKKIEGTFDFILSTVNVPLDWNSYMGLLRPHGKLCFVGVPDKPISIPVFSLLLGEKSICGSVIGSRDSIQEMLEFSARHNIAAKTEARKLSEVNEALEKVHKNQARYRMVLEV